MTKWHSEFDTEYQNHGMYWWYNLQTYISVFKWEFSPLICHLSHAEYSAN